MSKNILLVSPLENTGPNRNLSYPSGALILIGTMLYNKGYNVKIVHLATDTRDINEFKSIVSSFKPDIVGITVNTFQTKSAKDVSKAIKEIDKNIIVVVGGPHPSSLKHNIFKEFQYIDISVIGEGENTFIEIVEGKDLSEIKGICYNDKLNEPRKEEDNLDYIPLPNLDLIDINKFIGADPVGAYPSMYIMASRGCPYQCIFCNKSVWGRKIRFRKPELVINEIEWLHEKYGVREIFFLDDNFNLNRKWAETIMNMIIEKNLNKKIVYKTSFRVNEQLVDEDLLKLAKAAGFWLIFFGVESGSQKMLDNMKKGFTVNEVKRAFKLAHKVGLKTLGSFIIGLPGETYDTVKESIKLWKEIHPYVTGCSPAIPFPETEFAKIAASKGHLISTNYDEYTVNKFLVRTDELTVDEIRNLCIKFRKKIILRFLIDLIKLRYIKMMFYSLNSIKYPYHIYLRIKAYLNV